MLSFLSRPRIAAVSINETQKNILQGIFKFYFDDFSALSKQNEMKALEALTSDSISPARIQLFERIDIMSTIQEIKNILNHPCPQNRTENYPYFGAPADNNYVVFRNSHGAAQQERKGLLSLSARNDSTAAPITKEATIAYIHLLIEQAKKNCLERRDSPVLPHKFSFIEDQSLLQADQWIITVAQHKVTNKKCIFIEGLRAPINRFTDSYELHINAIGFYTIIAKSLGRCDLNNADYHHETFVIHNIQGERIKKHFRKEIFNATKGVRLSFLGFSSTTYSQADNLALDWMDDILNQIDIKIDKDHFITNRNRGLCSIM